MGVVDCRCGRLAYSNHTDAATRFDFAEFFNGYRSAAATAFTATHIAERIAALLDGDRGQP